MNDRIKYILNGVEGINWVGIVIFLVFFILFILVVWFTLKRTASSDSYMADLPLEDSEKPPDQLS